MPGVAVGRGYVKGTKEVTDRKKEKRNMDGKDQPNLSFMQFVRTTEHQETQRIYVPSMDHPKWWSIFNIELIRHLSTIAFPCSIIGTLIIPNSLMAFDQLSCRPPARIPAIDV